MAPAVLGASPDDVDAVDRWAMGLLAAVLIGTYAGRLLPGGPVAVACLALCAVLVVSHPERWEHRTVPLAPLATIAVVWATLVVSVRPTATFSRLVSQTSLTLVALVTGAVLGTALVRRAIALAGKITIVVSFIAMAVAPGWAISPIAGVPGWAGVGLHKNQFGFTAAITLVCVWFDQRPRQRRVWIVLSLVCVLGSRSSTALGLTIAFAGVLVLSAAGRGLTDRESRAIAAVVALPATIVVVAAGVVNLPAITALFGKDPTLTGRTDIWRSVVDFIGQRPWLGYGWNTVWPESASDRNLTDVAYTVARNVGFDVVSAHSGYLDLLLGAGLIGASAFIGLLVATFLAGRRIPELWADERLWVASIVTIFAIDTVTESNFALGFFAVLVATHAGAVGGRAASAASDPDDSLGDTHDSIQEHLLTDVNGRP